MELKDLIGIHELSGVDVGVEKINTYKDFYDELKVVTFIVDETTYKGVVYDDYISTYFDKLEITNKTVLNNFTPQKVIVKKKDDNEMVRNNIIQFISIETNKLILEIGNDDIESNLSYHIVSFYPENIVKQ